MAVLLESDWGLLGSCPVLVTHAEIKGDIVQGIHLEFVGYQHQSIGDRFKAVSVKTGRTYSYRKLPALLRYVKTSIKQHRHIGQYELKTPFSSVLKILSDNLYFRGGKITETTDLAKILSDEAKLSELAENFRVSRYRDGMYRCGEVEWSASDSTEQVKERLVNRVHSLLSVDDFYSIRRMFRGS